MEWASEGGANESREQRATSSDRRHPTVIRERACRCAAKRPEIQANWVVPQERCSCPLRDRSFLLFTGRMPLKGVAKGDVAMATLATIGKAMILEYIEYGKGRFHP